MPIYEFACDECGLRFEVLMKYSESNTHPCKGCGEAAPKQVTAANFTFAHKPTGPVPQNTGVHSIDYSYDTVIGRDAAQKWKVVEERQKEKHKVMTENNVSGFDLKKDPKTGTYSTLKPEERKASESARTLHSQALGAIQESKKKDS